MKWRKCFWCIKCHHQTAYPRSPARPPSFLPAELLAWFLELQAQWNSLKVGRDLGLLKPETNFHIKKGAKLLHCTLYLAHVCLIPKTESVRLFCNIWLVCTNPNPPHMFLRACQEAARGRQILPPTCRSPKSVITYDKVHQAMPLSRLRLWLYTASHRGSVKCANIYSPPLGSISATA